jgi:hypothetical protein
MNQYVLAPDSGLISHALYSESIPGYCKCRHGPLKLGKLILPVMDRPTKPSPFNGINNGSPPGRAAITFLTLEFITRNISATFGVSSVPFTMALEQEAEKVVQTCCSNYNAPCLSSQHLGSVCYSLLNAERIVT